MTTPTPKTIPAPGQCLKEAGLGASLLTPEDSDFAARQDSYWSDSAKIEPACILLPNSAEEVATAVKALAAAGQKFAIRSGGHTNWAGSNNIEGGVTLDLSRLNTTVFDPDTETAAIAPGNRWREVYAELHKHGRVVAGGREGNVGAAGLLLGGGNTYFTAQTGFACDNVVEYEVVLADGQIVNANKDENEDLFRALKGGSNNFGIVTSFKMNAIKCDKVWGGMSFMSKTNIPTAIEALHDFTANVENDKESNLVFIITHMPDFKDIVIATMYVQVGGVEKAPAFKKWLEIPEMMSMVKMTSISEMAFEYNIPSHYRDVWFTICFKNESAIITEASRLHDILVEELKAFIPDGDFITQCLFQPLPALFARNSAAVGGNVMGMERQKDDGIMFLAVAMVKTPEQEAFAYPKIKAWVEAVRDFAAQFEGGNLEWKHLNYADKSQNVLECYGSDNVRKMKEVAAKYDPDQVFQKLVPGGFKISQV